MISQSAGKSFAYLLGVYLGDGCVTVNYGKPVFRLNTIDRDFQESTKSAIEHLSDRPVYTSTHPVKKSSKPNHSLSCFDEVLCKRLQKATEKKSRIPEELLQSDEEKRQFIVGLMDSEGFVCANQRGSLYMGYAACDSWIPQFIKFVQKFGLRIGKVTTTPKRHKPQTRFHIKLGSWLETKCYFNIKRKQKRIDDFVERRLSSETIRWTSQDDDIVRAYARA